eukprot:TRINITY_DN11076_c0_g1_i3.p1 TRINITY_DN11076_c0_g1~~TRINITY_DN11076_c0_g1_i3.p1  ORF type:complete len:109 (-),score=16.19 TRINITY_DN11076_c0_g1_i3:215-541(-)
MEDLSTLLTLECPEHMKANVFTVNRAMFVCGYYGGLRGEELYELEYSKVSQDDYGFWFCFQRKKQRGPPELSTFLVPKGLAADVFNIYFSSVDDKKPFLWRAAHTQYG